MLFGLTGAHGTGKSTILKGVKEFGVEVVESSLSRQAQKALGWTDLTPAENDEMSMWKFQEQILAAMYDRDMTALLSGNVVLVDRTPADVWGYVALWSHRLGGVNQDYARDFKNRCRAMAAKYTRHIIVPVSSAFEFVAEPNRADMESRDFHEKEVCHFIVPAGLPHTVILETNAEKRVQHLASMLNSIKVNLGLFKLANGDI